MPNKHSKNKNLSDKTFFMKNIINQTSADRKGEHLFIEVLKSKVLDLCLHEEQSCLGNL